MKRTLSLILCAVLTVLLCAGCGGNTPAPTPGGAGTEPQESKAQLVVALNPVLDFGENGTVVLFNDIKNAVSADRDGATLTALADTTSWSWAYKTDDKWKKRGIYELGRWRNGGYLSADRLNAYSFSDDGTVSLMPYTSAAAELTTYQGEVPGDVGVLLSVSGSEEESVCYEVVTGGQLVIPAGKITAIASVGGVKTGFLAEDGTERSAVVKFILNSYEIWSGEFGNSTATGGAAVTELAYPDLSGITLNPGDRFFISVRLDAHQNAPGDISSEPSGNGGNDGNDEPYVPDYPYDSDPSGSQGGGTGGTTHTPSGGQQAGGTGGTPSTPQTPSQQAPSDTPSTPPASSQTPSEPEPPHDIPLMDGYDVYFGSIIYPTSASVEDRDSYSVLRESMVTLFDTDVAFRNDNTTPSGPEILIGLTNREESKRAYEDLRSARANHASDYIVRVDGDKLVFAADSSYAMGLAIQYFMDTYCQSDESVLPAGMNVVYRPAVSNITLNGENIASFTIRTEKYPSLIAVRAAQQIAQYVIEHSGYNLSVGKDTTETKNEILVGLTSRSLPASTFKNDPLDGVKGKKGDVYDANKYRMFMDGGKFYIEAGSEYAASCAVQLLLEDLDKTPSLSASYDKSGEYEAYSYTMQDNFACTWSDDFLSTAKTKVNARNWGTNTNYGSGSMYGPWYKRTDPYYLKSKASWDNADPSDNFGGPWYDATDPTYAAEGLWNNDASFFWMENNAMVIHTEKDLTGYQNCMVSTRSRMNFRYGICEFRLKMATQNGCNHTVWLTTDGYGGGNEIDIAEGFGEDKVVSCLHTWADDQPDGHTNHASQMQFHQTVRPVEGEHFYDTYHHLALEWTPEYIRMYMDGELYTSQDITSPTWSYFHKADCIHMNVESGSGTYNVAGTNPGNLLGDQVEKLYTQNGYIDYVRLYQIQSKQYTLKAKR